MADPVMRAQASSMSVVLKASELEALKRRTLTGKMVLGGDSTSAESDALRRTERKAASLEKSAKWGDTLLAQRQAKEDARRKREEDLEAARLVIDKEEEELRAKERLEAVKRANEILINQTERMKALKSQKLLSDITDVRERQLAMKERKEAMARARDAEHHERLLRQMAEYDDKEAEAKRKAEEKIRLIAQSQQEQKDAFLQRYVTQLQQEKEEGERIKQNAAALVEEEKRAAAEKAAEARIRNIEMQKRNEAIRVARELAKVEEAKQVAEHERYAEEKERAARRKTDFVEYKKQEKAKQAAKMKETMERDFMSRMADEGARLDSQVAEAEAKRDADLAAEAARRKAVQDSINASRQAQLARKQALKEAEAESERRFKDQWTDVQAQLEAEELEDKAAQRRKKLELQASHLQMAYAKETAIDAARRRAREDEADAAARAAAADKEFDALADRLIQEEVSRGHNPVPAARAMARTKGEKLIPANSVF